MIRQIAKPYFLAVSPSPSPPLPPHHAAHSWMCVCVCVFTCHNRTPSFLLQYSSIPRFLHVKRTWPLADKGGIQQVAQPRCKTKVRFGPTFRRTDMHASPMHPRQTAVALHPEAFVKFARVRPFAAHAVHFLFPHYSDSLALHPPPKPYQLPCNTCNINTCLPQDTYLMIMNKNFGGLRSF